MGKLWAILGIGEFCVEIRAIRTVGALSNQNDPTLVNAKEVVPSRYNSKSELVKEMKSGENIANFEFHTGLASVVQFIARKKAYGYRFRRAGATGFWNVQLWLKVGGGNNSVDVEILWEVTTGCVRILTNCGQ